MKTMSIPKSAGKLRQCQRAFYKIWWYIAYVFHYIHMLYRHWTFKTQEWTQLPGEMIYPHYGGTAVLAGDKLYAFCGRSVLVPQHQSGTQDAEVYDFQEGFWTDLPKTPSGYNVDQLTGLAISDSKILLVGGRWPGVEYAKMSYIYDTESQVYIFAGERNTVDHRGTEHYGCAVMPGGLKVICAGGWNDDAGLIAR